MKRSPSEVLEFLDAFFMKRSSVHQAASRIAQELTALEIPFAITGGLAVSLRGHVRATEDVDVLLTAEGLAKFKATWLGRGWVERFQGSRGLRDAVVDVRVDVLLTGDFPGDGKPKPVAFPDPALVGEMNDEMGYPVVKLPTLIELKLACSMTVPDRPRDFDDVIQLIRANDLPQDYSESLDPYVRAKFLELWTAAQYKGPEY